MLISDLCDYNDAYTVVKGTLTVEGDDDDKKKIKKLTFKNNAPFRSCISKINKTLLGNLEDLGNVIKNIIGQNIVAIIL